MGYFYIFLGIIILFIPLIYIELGRPRDLIKAGLNLIIGMILILKQKMFDTFSVSIIILITFLVSYYIMEIFSIRWNQLTDTEKNKLRTLLEFKKNISKLMEAVLLLVKNFLNSINIFKSKELNKNLIKKKWVRDDENVNISNQNKNKRVTLEMQKKTKTESKEDIIL